MESFEVVEDLEQGDAVVMGGVEGLGSCGCHNCGHGAERNDGE